MFIVLFLVIAVASFNIVSTLIMAVNDKKGDIAILKTMGASSKLIMLTFIYWPSSILIKNQTSNIELCQKPPVKNNVFG